MGNAIFQGFPAPEPLNKFSKFGAVDYFGDPTHMQKFVSFGPKEACLRMHEIVIVGRLFFSFLGFLVSCSSLQVRPLDL